MKNIKKYLLYFFCLLTLSCGLNSCVVHEGDDTHSTGATTWQLCNHRWNGVYTDRDGLLVDHEIIFYPDGTGNESLIFDDGREWWEEQYDFYWDWANSQQTSIALRYPRGGVLYMDHVYIDFDYFSCLLDGVFVEFRGY